MSAHEPLRILMTADAVGGVWQYALGLAGALGVEGHEITLAVLGPNPTSEQRQDALATPGVSLVETGLELDWMAPGPEPIVQAAQAIAALADERGADVIHCNMPTLAAAAAFAQPVVAVTHGCVASWWLAAKSEPLAADFEWHRDCMRRGLAAADAVVAPSASYAATIREVYGLPWPPQVVHNGRAPLTQPSDAPPGAMVLTVGRQWDPVKQAALLDRVAARLDAQFIAAGPLVGPHGESVTLTRLHAIGSIDSTRLAGLLARRPVFVSAATFEPFGLAVLEAAQASCPLVLSDIATFRELWDGAALFVTPDDEDGFHAAIAALLADSARAQALGALAAERAARFTPAATAVGMGAIYAQLLARHEAAA